MANLNLVLECGQEPWHQIMSSQSRGAKVRESFSWRMSLLPPVWPCRCLGDKATRPNKWRDGLRDLTISGVQVPLAVLAEGSNSAVSRGASSTPTRVERLGCTRVRRRYISSGLSQTTNPLTVSLANNWIPSQFYGPNGQRPRLKDGLLGRFAAAQHGKMRGPLTALRG